MQERNPGISITLGITANSPALDIVNNQLPAFIPEPASAALWMLAAFATLISRRFST